MDLIGLACVGLVLGVGAVALISVLRGFLHICRPNEVLVFSGRKHTLPDGTTVGYRVVHGGFSIQVPFLEQVDRMSLQTIPIEIGVTNAYSKGGIPLDVSAVANVKVSSNMSRLPNAIERFQGRDLEEIRRVAKESLEGHIRGTVARLTPEEVNEDRLKFAEEMVEEAGEDFQRLGIDLDTVKIQSVSDNVDYLDSIGRERLARVVSTAEIAESTAKADAEEAQAEAARAGSVANEQAEQVITESENDLRKKVAEWEARAKSEEERAEQSALAARSRAEQKLQELRARLENLRLQADRVLPAEASRKASEMSARGEAAHIAADGEAMAEVLSMLSEAWIAAGDDAADIFLIQQLEQVLQTVVSKVKAMEIGEVTLLDGGSGQALPSHVAALPATVKAVLGELFETTGVDVTGILTRRPEPVEVP